MLLSAAGKDLKTDLGPMELGGLITAMGTTHLETKRLGGRPFFRDGLSYWDAEWPPRQPISIGWFHHYRKRPLPQPLLGLVGG